jgi:hypothetical protein
MLRITIAFVFALAVCGTANAADRALPHRGWHRAAGLPAGLPRPHYKFKTTITLSQPYSYLPSSPRLSVYEAPEALYAPGYTDVPYIAPLAGAPLLPGSSTLPGYYGASYSYDYPDPYYGGRYLPYWDRLPYACGVYGYC